MQLEGRRKCNTKYFIWIYFTNPKYLVQRNFVQRDRQKEEKRKKEKKEIIQLREKKNFKNVQIRSVSR